MSSEVPWWFLRQAKLAGGGGSAPSVWGLAQHSYKHDATTAISHTYTYPAANAAGNLLTMVVGWFTSASNQAAPTVSDSVNGAWTKAGATAVHSVDICQAIYYRASCLAGSPTVTITFPVAAPVEVQAQEWSGAAPTSPNDVNATGHGSGATAPTASATTTTGNQLILGGLTTYDGSGYSPGAGFLPLDNNVTNGVGSEYKILAAAGPVNVDFNHGNNEWVSGMATFKPLSSGTPPPPSGANTWTAAGVDRASVLAAITSAAAGDTVIIPAGSASWSASITVPVPITIKGQGTLTTSGKGSTKSQATKITNSTGATSGLETPLFVVSPSSDQRTEIYGIYFASQGQETAANGSDAIAIYPNGVLPNQIVIHDCTFDSFSFGILNDSAFGVVYYCTFINCKINHRNSGFYNAAALYGTFIPVPAWGTRQYMVYEDCDHLFGNYGLYPYATGWTGGPLGSNYMADTEFPMNYIVRQCTFTINRLGTVQVDGFDMHGSGNAQTPTAAACNNYGFVIHDNVFNYTGSSAGAKLADIRGGVGSLIYNNIIHGQNGDYISLRTDPPGSLAPTQSYTWGNVQDSGAITDPGSVGPPAGFAEVAYPHPLR
jgi:hypothetical protein